MAELIKNKEYETPVMLPFEWEDITDDILKDLIFIEYKRGDLHSTCCIHCVTKEGREYLAEFDDEDKGDDIRELFLGENAELDDRYAEDTRDFRAMGKWLYKRIYFRESVLQIFVRKDFFDRFISEYEKRNVDPFAALNTVRKLLNRQGKVPRMIHSQTLAAYE